MLSTSRLPAMRRWKAASGISTTLSWSWPKPEKPFGSSRPMTRQLILPTRTVEPSGSPAPKNCWRTVSPSRQTPAPLRTSDSLNSRPGHDLPVARLEIAVVGAGDGDRQAFGAEHDAHLLLRGGRDGARAGQMPCASAATSSSSSWRARRRSASRRAAAGGRRARPADCCRAWRCRSSPSRSCRCRW